MSERPVGAPHEPGAPFDHEIDVRAIAKGAVWLAVITGVSFLVAWFFYKALVRSEERLDPRVPVLEAARKPVVPPGPRLQRSPEADLAQHRGAERGELESWAWVDRGRGLARVPVERAIDAVAASGRLPEFAGAAAAEPPAEEPAP